MAELIDGFGRRLDYLRISVTDRCNFRCRYCMPPEGTKCVAHDEILRYEEIEFLCKVFCELGVKKIRITGGEPLVRKDLVPFLKKLKRDMPQTELALTTNASLLAPFAQELADSGIESLNISLDTVDAEKFKTITRCGCLDNVIDGIDAANAAGLKLKLNTVLIKGFNDAETDDILAFADSRNAILRLIEFMPLESGVWNEGKFICGMDVISRMKNGAFWRRTDEAFGCGPARYYRNEKDGMIIGIITAVSNHFCENCRRLRISSTGALRTCLFSPQETPLREVIKKYDADELKKIILESIRSKPRGWSEVISGKNHMSSIGG